MHITVEYLICREDLALDDHFTCWNGSLVGVKNMIFSHQGVMQISRSKNMAQLILSINKITTLCCMWQENKMTSRSMGSFKMGTTF